MNILDHIEWQIAHEERMKGHSARMEKIRFALAYSQAVEGIPLRVFGEVVMICRN
jgi:hypothetical protein